MGDYRYKPARRRPRVRELLEIGLTYEEVARALSCSIPTVNNDARAMKREGSPCDHPRLACEKFDRILRAYAEQFVTPQPDDELLHILGATEVVRSLSEFLAGAVLHYTSLTYVGETIPAPYRNLLAKAWHDAFLWKRTEGTDRTRDLTRSVLELFLTEILEDEQCWTPETVRLRLLDILDRHTVRSDIVLHVDARRLVALVNEALSYRIPTPNAQALCLHFGIGDQGPMKLDDVAGQCGITRAAAGYRVEVGVDYIRRALQQLPARAYIETHTALVTERALLQEKCARLAHEKDELLRELQLLKESIAKEEHNSVALMSDPEFQQALNTPVKDLEFSARVDHCFAKAHITTVRDIVAKSEKELLRIKSFGSKCLHEVKEVLTGLHPALHPGMTLPY